MSYIHCRYPNLATAESLYALWEWLRAPNERARLLLMTQNGVHDAACGARLRSYMTENSAEFISLAYWKWDVFTGVEATLALSGYLVHDQCWECALLSSPCSALVSSFSKRKFSEHQEYYNRRTLFSDIQSHVSF